MLFDAQKKFIQQTQALEFESIFFNSVINVLIKIF